MPYSLHKPMTLDSRSAPRPCILGALRRSLCTAIFASFLLGLGTPSLAQNTQTKSAQPTLELLERQFESLSSRAAEAVNQVTQHALSLIGVRYRFGSEDPERGLDCSGLIRHVFQQTTGITLPRSAREQAKIGAQVAIHELQPGDLVFFNTRRFQFSHVGIYLGNNEFIHAPSRGKAVEIVRLDQPYWQRAFNGARRVIDAMPALAAVGLASPAHAMNLPSSQTPASPRSPANSGTPLLPVSSLPLGQDLPPGSRFAQ